MIGKLQEKWPLTSQTVQDMLGCIPVDNVIVGKQVLLLSLNLFLNVIYSEKTNVKVSGKKLEYLKINSIYLSEQKNKGMKRVGLKGIGY